MSAPFASKLFENTSNNTDGWDEWDWVDNNNATNVTKGQQQQQQQHQTQFIQQPLSPGFPTLQNTHTRVQDNTANFFNPANNIPAPTLDHSIQQPEISGQFTATLPNNNNNNINSSIGFQQDPIIGQHQQQLSYVNNNANTIVQSAGLQNYQRVQSSNSLGFMQVESQELPTPIVPPIPARAPFNEQLKTEQNANSDIGFMTFANTAVQSTQVIASIEPQTAPVQVFSNNILPSVLPPPNLNQSPFANTNPFKRVGSHAHRTPPPPPTSTATVNAPAPAQEVFNTQAKRIPHAQDPIETITHNDRNEYLQTGHLSEDGENIVTPNVESQTQYSSSDGNGDSLPPPGLSRLVLGEHEAVELNNIQPPPGLDRLVTGTEISQSDINLERQADGQDNSNHTKPPQVIRSNSQFSSIQTHPSTSIQHSLSIENQSYENDSFEPISESDRNQYLVAGENVIDNTNVTTTTQIAPNANIQRVVTGLENVENREISLPKRQREVDMDGENVEDQHTQNRFANATNTLSQADSIEDLDTSGNYNQKIQSNPSTGDDSEREKYYGRSKGQSSKRGDERRKKRDDSRYETEDTDHSTRERRRPKENDRFAEKERKYRGRSADVDENDSRVYRDRGEKQYRGEKHYRPPSRDDEDRYEGRYRYGDGRTHRDNKHRYEPDASHFDKEDSRYDRNRRRNDRERGDRERDNYGRYRDDRYYKSKDFDRETRDDRDHHRARDERYSEFDNVNKTRRDRKKDRSVNGSERGEYSYYHPTVAQPYGYDPYTSYYQNQQYYENLRRTNPVAYAEWYNRYFANQLGIATSSVANAASERGRESGRESVHSGRSSSKDNDRYMLSASHSFYHSYGANQLHSHAQQLSHNLFSSLHNSTMLDNASTIHHSHQYASSEIGSRSPFPHKLSQHQLSSADGIATSLEPERLTPLKFTSTHCSSSFQNGILVSVKQKYLPTNEIQNNVHLLKFALNNHTKRLYQTFPGPLSPETHTKQVIEFCIEQIRNGPNVPSLNSRSTSNSMSSLQSVDQPSRASFSLLWNFLILLLRHRGLFVGSDISELLLKNKEEFPYEQQQLNSTKLSNVQRDVSEQLSDVDSKDDSNDGLSNDSEQQTLSEKEVTEKFREFLLYGSINEALEWATDNNLWGHALFLASKMDRRSHANVMIKFANKLPLADPLQTLYQLKSGRVPLSVTSTQDEKWGDWRPHLAMIISNPSQTNAELDRKAIITMGDTLHNRGDLFAAQFCYLMAKVEFSRYSDVKHDSSMILNHTVNAGRLILLGTSCYKSSFADFATDEAIIMTEIYEYACSLPNSQFSIVEFQPYKYLLGTRMLDYGFHLKSLLYMEQVARHIQMNPAQYNHIFIEKVHNLADKLKYYDPVLEKNVDSLNDEDITSQINGQLQWQADLVNLLAQNDVLQPSITFTENTVPIIPMDPYLQQTVSQAPATNITSQIDQEFSQINQQFHDLSLQYQNSSYEYGNGTEATSGQPTDANTMNNYADNPNQYAANQYEQHEQTDYYGQQQQQQSEMSRNLASGYSEQSVQQSYQTPTYNDPLTYGASNYGANEAVNDQKVYETIQTPRYFDNPTSLQSHSTPLNRLSEQEEEDDDGDYDDDDVEGGCEEDVMDNMPKPTISMPSSFSSKPGFYDDSDQPVANSQKMSESKDANKLTQDKKKPTPNGINDNSKSGWIGGIFNKLTFKPKNQMILPDDKNPSIIWDEQNKRWMNKDQDEDEKESFKPPPKMTGIPSMPQPTNNPIQTPNIPTLEPSNIPTPNLQISNANSSIDPTGTGKPPSLQSNMFKMQRNKSLKKSYVDPFNPSGAAPKNDAPILAPMMPSNIPTQTNFFVPATTSNTNQQNDEQPTFYNPNQYGGYQQQ